MSVVGFDIGNENCYIAAVKSGGIEIVDNEYSLRSTPTYVAFTERSRDIGVSARAKLVTNLENTVFGFKRILGKKHEDSGVQEELGYLPHEICEMASGYIGIKVNYLKNNVIFSTEQLMAMMLYKLKMIAESKLGNKVRDCVIAVPVYYTDTQRRAMLDAINISGLNALKIVNESTAVALSYGFFKQNFAEQEFQNVVFVDLGNSSLTVTACAFTKDKGKILGCVWDDVGGRDFDNKLVQHFIDDFKVRYNVDAIESKKALMALMLECEMLKKVMSANSLQVGFQIECFMQDKDVNGLMKREHFENLSTHILNRIEVTLHRILIETQLKPSDIHSVEIVGGSSRIPAVKRLIQKVFGREPNATLNQDEAIARGCALQCAVLSPSLKTRNFVIEDVPSYIIKILWKNCESREQELEVFSLGDKVPSSKLITISMSKPFSLEACYVELPSKMCKIGTFTLGNIPEAVEENALLKVKIKASLNVHGIFTLASAKMIEKNVGSNQNNQVVCYKGEKEDEKVTLMTEDEENVSSAEQLAQDVKSSCVVRSYDLSIKTDVPGLTKIRLSEYISAEQQMMHRDVEEKEKADARNALEEYIYSARGKLNYELEEFVLENDKTRFLEDLSYTENWLYENEELEAVEYSKKLNEFKCSFDPIFKRYFEWEQRPSVIADYREVLQQAYNAINNFINLDQSTTILPEDIENLRKIWQNSKQYLYQCNERFSKLQKTEDIPITVDEIRKSLANFRTEFQNSYSELKRKLDKTEKPSPSSSGDGTSESSGASDLGCKESKSEETTNNQSSDAENQNAN